MLTTVTVALVWSPDSAEAVVGLVVAAVIAFLGVLWNIRERRNGALENILARSEFGSPDTFRGTLAIAEHQPRTYLRLSKSTAATGRLQFYYRWVAGKGRQAVFDEVTFDGFLHLVDLKR